MRLLNGDIGGTKTLLELVELDGAEASVVARRRYPSRDYDHFEKVVDDFLASCGNPRVAVASFGVAGPVEEREGAQKARVTNLPWRLDGRALARRFGFQKVVLLNDFAAVAHGIGRLGPEQLATLQEGEPRPIAGRLVIGAGTGLGVAQLPWCGEGHAVVATEGGHAGFAPCGELQTELLRWGQGQWGRVSWEHLLSGPGLTRIYRFLLHHLRAGSDAAALLEAPDPAAAIAIAAGRGEEPAARALGLFVELYGAAAGDFALASLPFGGLFVAGGIAPKILDHLRTGPFLDAFNAKGPMAPLMARIPVRVVTDPDVGLLGSRATGLQVLERLASTPA